jgi:phosphinothricin acetyltransferase
VKLRPLQPDDWPAVEAIYAAGIATGNATFEADPPSWEHFAATHTLDLCLVAFDEADTVMGWIAAGPVADRCVYAGVMQHSVYVHPSAQGHGVGNALLSGLIALTESRGIWTLQSGIFPENTASLRLHEACGFRELGRRERIGRHHGRWRDVVFVERRSRVVGTD